jgi:steroid delta-isomerase-like uncharacterized protein
VSEIRRSVIAAVGAAFLMASGCRQAADTRDTATEQNTALVRRWIDEGFNRRSLAVVDELFAERVVVNGQVVGRDGLTQSMRRHLDGFPDLHVTIDDILAEGKQVAVWYTVQGTHQGEFEAIPPTGKRVSWVGVDLFSFEDGRISEARFLSDFHGLLAQLGATVSPPHTPTRVSP